MFYFARETAKSPKAIIIIKIISVLKKCFVNIVILAISFCPQNDVENNQNKNNSVPHIPVRIYVFALQKSSKHPTTLYQNEKGQNNDHVPNFKDYCKHLISELKSWRHFANCRNLYTKPQAKWNWKVLQS